VGIPGVVARLRPAGSDNVLSIGTVPGLPQVDRGAELGERLQAALSAQASASARLAEGGSPASPRTAQESQRAAAATDQFD